MRNRVADSAMTVASLDTLARYVSPINPAVFPHLALVLLGIGIFFTAWFFVYEVIIMIIINEIEQIRRFCQYNHAK